jgi:DNA-binding transcriptional ArsR family regulator
MSTDSRRSPESRPGAREEQQKTSAESEAEEMEEGVELSLDNVFAILKNERRRRVLHYLRDEEQRVTLSDLAEHIAAIENDTSVQSITSSQRKRVYVGLYQCHLSKMDDMDIIDFNKDRGIVEIGDNAPQLFEYLDGSDEEQANHTELFFGIGLLGGVALLALGLTGAPTAAVFAAFVGQTVLLGCAVGYSVATRSGESLVESLNGALQD